MLTALGLLAAAQVSGILCSLTVSILGDGHVSESWKDAEARMLTSAPHQFHNSASAFFICLP